jgi:hypothetical protein
MMKKNLEQELSYLGSSIKLTDFNTIERGLKYHLRFELGDPFENGTKKRVKQATKRATELFENHIEENSDVYILIYDFNDEMFARTPNYIHEILNTEPIKYESYNEKLALRYFAHETDIEWTSGKLTIYLANKNDIPYSKIFNGIANTEIGFEPTVHQLVYFFQPSSKKWFWMYDDRGCLMFSDEVSDLKENLNKFDSWIVETQRSEMEKQFA